MEFEDGKQRGRAAARARPSPAARRGAAPGRRPAERPRAPCMPRTFSIATSSRRTSSSGATAFPSSSTSARRVRRSGERTRHAHQRADAAICADRAVCARRQAGAVERHLLGRRRAASCAIAGQPPPEAARRVGDDPYRPLAETQADRFDPSFLAAIDRGAWPSRRPSGRKTVDAMERAVRPSRCRRTSDAPTQRLASADRLRRRAWAASAAPRSSRDAMATRRRCRDRVAAAVVARRLRTVVVVMAAMTLWRFQPEIRQPDRGHPHASTTPVAVERHRLPDSAAARDAAPTQSAATPPARQPRSAATHRHTPAALPPSADAVAQKALIDQAQRAAREARAVLERADEAARTARVRWRARRASSRRGRRGRTSRMPSGCHTDDGASYVGQAADGKRQGSRRRRPGERRAPGRRMEGRSC